MSKTASDSSNPHHNEPKSAKRKQTAKKAYETLKVHFVDDAGNTIFDATNKKYHDLPDEIRAAMRPAQEMFAKLQVKSAWEKFYSNLPPDLRNAYDNASRDDRKKCSRFGRTQQFLVQKKRQM